jgi:plasmid maintenance system antidote protein VapI
VTGQHSVPRAVVWRDHSSRAEALWINLQAQYYLAVAEQEFGAQIAREVEAA